MRFANWIKASRRICGRRVASLGFFLAIAGQRYAPDTHTYHRKPPPVRLSTLRANYTAKIKEYIPHNIRMFEGIFIVFGGSGSVCIWCKHCGFGPRSAFASNWIIHAQICFSSTSSQGAGPPANSIWIWLQPGLLAGIGCEPPALLLYQGLFVFIGCNPPDRGGNYSPCRTHRICCWCRSLRLCCERGEGGFDCASTLWIIYKSGLFVGNGERLSRVCKKFILFELVAVHFSLIRRFFVYFITAIWQKK